MEERCAFCFCYSCSAKKGLTRNSSSRLPLSCQMTEPQRIMGGKCSLVFPSFLLRGKGAGQKKKVCRWLCVKHYYQACNQFSSTWPEMFLQLIYIEFLKPAHHPERFSLTIISHAYLVSSIMDYLDNLGSGGFEVYSLSYQTSN